MNSKSVLFQQFNEEINEFYKSLKEAKYSDQEIRNILKPITTPIVRKKHILYSFAIISIVILLYYLLDFEVISWHLSAIARILMIKMLPYWDWTPLKNQKCLLDYNVFTAQTEGTNEVYFNCDFCESLETVDVLTTGIDPDLLQIRYLDVHTPVIIATSFNWSTPQIIVDGALSHEILSESIPCRLGTNTNQLTTVGELLRRLELFDSFFIHFQNCDFEAMKEFRQFAPRPQFLPVELSPIQYNWLLWNRNYNISMFKSVELVDRVAVFGQILGESWIRLQPRSNCFELCNDLYVKLEENQSLVLTSLWDLEYKPDGNESFAVILETH